MRKQEVGPAVGFLFILLMLVLCLSASWFQPYLATAAPSSTPSASPKEVLKISGCSISRAGYLDFLAAAFTERTGIKVLIKGGGSAAGLLNLAADSVDLAASCLPPEAEPVPAGVRMIPVAWDSLVFVVPSSNPLAGISLEQARAIFLGQVSNWQDLGGPNQPLSLYLQYTPRAKMQGVPYFIQKKFLDGREITANPAVLQTRPSGGLVEEALARDPWGFAGTGFTSARLKSDKLRMLAVNGITPSRKTIISGAYPAELQRHLYLALRGSASPATERFLTFVLSKEGQNLLRAHGAIALTDLP